MKREVGVARALVARVPAQVAATDGVPVGLQSVGQVEVLLERLRAAQVGLPQAVYVIVFIERRIENLKHKQVGVAAKGEVGKEVQGQRLTKRGKPALGAFARLVRTVKQVCAIRPIGGAQQNLGGGERFGHGEKAVQRERVGVVTAIVLSRIQETVRGVARAGQGRGKARDNAGQFQMLFCRAQVASAQAQCPGGLDWRRGNQVDRATDGVRAEEGRTRAMQDVDARHRFEGQRQVEVQVAGLWIVQPQAVDQHKRLLESGAPDGDISLHTRGTALDQGDRGVKAQVGHRRLKERLGRRIARVERAHGPIDRIGGVQRQGLCRSDTRRLRCDRRPGSLLRPSTTGGQRQQQGDCLPYSHSRMILTKMPSGSVAPPSRCTEPSRVKPRSMVGAVGRDRGSAGSRIGEGG